MTDWMLYDFAKKHSEAEIQHRIDWLNKQGNSWLADFVEASNQKADLDNRLWVADNQVKCYASEVKELTELAKQFGKLKEG